MIQKNFIILTILALTISGCSILGSKKVEIVTKPVEIEIIQPQLPRPVQLTAPKWYVVSNKNLDEFLTNIEKEAGQMVFVAMSVPDYELMAYNLQEIKRFVKETKEVIVYYRTVMSDDENIEEKSDNGKGNN